MGLGPVLGLSIVVSQEPGEFIEAVGKGRSMVSRAGAARGGAGRMLPYVASWTSACLKMYSSSGHLPAFPDQLEPEQLLQLASSSMPAAVIAASTRRRKLRPTTDATLSTSLTSSSSRSIRARTTPSTVSGIGHGITDPLAARQRTISSRKNGLPSARSRRRSTLGSSPPRAQEAPEQLGALLVGRAVASGISDEGLEGGPAAPRA